MTSAGTANLLFATPVILDRLDLPDMDVGLEQAILTRRDTARNLGGGHLRGWQSDNALFSWGGEAALPLLAYILEVANAHTIVKGDHPDADYEWAAEAWASVSEAGVSMGARLHPDSYWSALYCVRADAGTGGELILLDPRSPAMEMSAPHLWFAEGGIQREASIAMPAGTLILFPSWLRHSLTPWMGEGLRIWIGMNISVKAS